MRNIIIVFFAWCLAAQAPSRSLEVKVLTWGGSFSDLLNGLVVDTQGNIYVIGETGGEAEIDFDPSDGEDIRMAGGMFLSKFDSNGNYVWCRTWSGNFINRSQTMVCDDEGNVYIAGQSWDAIDLDPGEDECNFTIPEEERANWVLKISPLGDFIWGKPLDFVITDIDMGQSLLLTGEEHGKIVVACINCEGSTEWELPYDGGVQPPYEVGHDHGLFIRNAESGFFLTGVFDGTEDLNPGESELVFSAQSGYDAFLTRHAQSGETMWGHTWESTYPAGGTKAMVIDADEKVYLAGTVATMTLGFTAFMREVDNQGNIEWEYEWYPASDKLGCFANCLAVDPRGIIYMGGLLLVGSTDFDPCERETIYAAFERSVGYVIGLSCEDHCLIDVFVADSSEGSSIWEIAMGTEGQMIIGGTYAGELQLDSMDEGSEALISNGLNDCFLIIRLGFEKNRHN